MEVPDPFSKNRDLPLDFIRGFAMLLVVINHLPIPSWFYILTVDRIGVVTGAELFVIISGLVLGMVHRERIAAKGFSASTSSLLKRAGELYLTIIGVTCAIWIIDALPGIDLSSIMTWTDPSTDVVYSLIPADPFADPLHSLRELILLRATPSQINILGYFVAMSLIAPAVLWMLQRGKAFIVVVISWSLYALNFVNHWRLIPAVFENPFPILSWQMPFISALVLGYHRADLKGVLRRTELRQAIAVSSIVFCAACIVYTWNNPWYSGYQYDQIPSWARLSMIPGDIFDRIYLHIFGDRTWLYLGRLLNAAAIILVLYLALIRWWDRAYRLAGWFFVPIGQASLYVFVMHLVVIPPLSQFANAHPNMMLNTLLHALALVALWTMVKTRFLFRLIPR